MIFNGRDIESFAKAKAIKFDVNYYTDFEHQEIVQNGLLCSFLEVPTVREITVSVFVRDKNKYELEQRIQQISDWLYSSGVAKLQSKRDTARYYKARCVSIDVPTFSGSSAKFDITFRCSDFRPYKTADDTPIGAAVAAPSNFTFADRHCLNDMMCMFKIESFTGSPAVNRNAYEISGRSGTIRYDNGPARLAERNLTGKLYFLKDNGSTDLMTAEEISERQHTIASWLINSKRSRLILDRDVSKFYEAEVIVASDVKTDDWANGVMSVAFVLQPFCEDIQPKIMDETVAVAAGSWEEIDLSGFGVFGYTTPLLIEITNTGNNDITDLCIRYYNDKDEEKELRFNGNSFALQTGQKLTIDSASYDATKGQEQALKFIKAGDFPSISPDSRKTILIYSNSSTGIDVSVTTHLRWL